MARILVVDDDHDIREFVRALLNLEGHEVFITDGAINALQLLRRNKIDVLVTDANMPNFTGFDLLKMIKLEGNLEHLTIVMLTGRREKKDVELALKAGAHDYIVKPIIPDKFVSKIRSLLEKRPIPERTDEADFPSVRLISKAKATLALDVRSISELGVVVRTAHELKPGALLHVECDVFREINIPPQDVRVFISLELDGIWETRLSFVNLDPHIAKRIRSWIDKSIRRAGAA